MRKVQSAAGQVDQAAYAALTRPNAPLLDRALFALTRGADYSKLSLAAAAALALAGGPRGRRSAVHGLAGLGLTALVANTAIKPLTHRRRPERAPEPVRATEWIVTTPRSTSFPSGHTAAAVAFATGVAHEWPTAAVPLTGLAALVGYSRVRTGVHFPGDVVAGALLGGGLALAASRLLDRLERPHPR
ncbi:phosphatase PAP2 family protein [Pengzhenrongella frigida]|uniref:Phosphatase PAP2 family protein n=2 Tax=Pengzhenrongella frigida TaxID=1259133 RepID=A0A4Q5N011_9MICO|nr:phosphatase PAP2 family protein [Cellulomonas sp. HLT2-17]